MVGAIAGQRKETDNTGFTATRGESPSVVNQSGKSTGEEVHREESISDHRISQPSWEPEALAPGGSGTRRAMHHSEVFVDHQDTKGTKEGQNKQRRLA
jgi:hypothetical protein